MTPIPGPSARSRTLAPVAPLAFVALAAVLAGCPTRTNEPDAGDAAFDIQPIDPRVPNVGSGDGGPSCSAEEVIDINAVGFHLGNEYRVRVDTRGRRNELRPDCAERDSSEAVIRYTAPPAVAGGEPAVAALRVSTVADATEFDTVLSVKNDCGPEYRDYACNNDGFLDDGRDTRRSVVYFNELEPEQYVYISVDGYDGNAGRAEVIVEEIPKIGVLGAPCIPVPPSMSMVPNIAEASFRCTQPGTQCRPGAASDGSDLCLPLLPLGAPCDPEERRNVCEPTYQRQVTCAQNPASRTEAVCALPGTAPGALCRRAEPRCDGRLACSPMAGFSGRDICVPLRSQGSPCDPAPVGYTTKCEGTTTCCGDAADAGANYVCRPRGYSPCFGPPVMETF